MEALLLVSYNVNACIIVGSFFDPSKNSSYVKRLSWFCNKRWKKKLSSYHQWKGNLQTPRRKKENGFDFFSFHYVINLQTLPRRCDLLYCVTYQSLVNCMYVNLQRLHSEVPRQSSETEISNFLTWSMTSNILLTLFSGVFSSSGSLTMLPWGKM